MANLNHELFGIRWSFLRFILERTTENKIFGKEKVIILSIDGNEEGEFHDVQKEAYTNLDENMDDVITKVEEAIFDYYQEVYMDYSEIVGEHESESDKFAPIIENKEELGHLVEPTQLIIRRVRNAF